MIYLYSYDESLHFYFNYIKTTCLDCVWHSITPMCIRNWIGQVCMYFISSAKMGGYEFLLFKKDWVDYCLGHSQAKLPKPRGAGNTSLHHMHMAAGFQLQPEQHYNHQFILCTQCLLRQYPPRC